MTSQTRRYLILPGWQGSPAEHWQSHWQYVLPNTVRVEQADWLNPQRDAWVTSLERHIAATPGRVILVAHSLGCITLAHWATQAQPALCATVLGALLVAPVDVEHPRCPEALQNFAPMPRSLLPFPSLLVGSDNDAAATSARALEMARQWGAEPVLLSDAGHINVQSGHCQWEQGFAYLQRLQSLIEQHARRQA